MGYELGFRPLSWGLSFNSDSWGTLKEPSRCFRPLSWGLSFNGLER